MPAPYKKRLRKVKDRLVHSANDIRAEMEGDRLTNDQRDKLDDAHTSVIDAVNAVVEAIQTES